MTQLPFIHSAGVRYTKPSALEGPALMSLPASSKTNVNIGTSECVPLTSAAMLYRHVVPCPFDGLMLAAPRQNAREGTSADQNHAPYNALYIDAFGKHAKSAPKHLALCWSSPHCRSKPSSAQGISWSGTHAFTGCAHCSHAMLMEDFSESEEIKWSFHDIDWKFVIRSQLWGTALLTIGPIIALAVNSLGALRPEFAPKRVES